MQNSEQLENQSTLGGLPSKNDLLNQSVRIRPVQFAKLCGVSKQAVSAWLKEGKITIYPDGTLDPKKAVKEYIQNSDPARVKASIFKVITDDVGTLKNEIAQLTEKLTEALEQKTSLLEAFQCVLYTTDWMFEEGGIDDLLEYLAKIRTEKGLKEELGCLLNFDINNINTGFKYEE